MFPVVNLHTVRLVLLAILALTFFPRQLNADFIPPYDLPNGFLQPFNFAAGSVTPVGSWTLHESGTPFAYTGSLIQTSSSQVSLMTNIAISHGFQWSLDLQLTHTILGTGILSFDYSLSLQETTGLTAGWNYGGYILDGVLTKLPAGTGSITVPVNAGDVFGFEAFATANCFECVVPGRLSAGATTLTITNFSAPVPEPATTPLLICGACLALARLRARARERQVVDLAIDQLRRS